MLRTALATGALLAISGSAFSQSTDTCAPCGTEPRDAGVYHLSTGRLTAPGTQAGTEGTSGIIYNNNYLPAVLYSATLNGSVLIDEGRVPSTTSPAPNQGIRQTYRVNAFEIAYCTRELDTTLGGPGATVNAAFWQDYDDCASLGTAGTPTASYTITGLPGSPTQGILACYIVTIDLTGGFEFCLVADANGAFDNSATLDGFGYGLSMAGQLGTTTATVGGFIVAGNPSGAPAGDGTFYKNPSATAGTGLGDDDLFYRQGAGGQSTGCFFFNGNPYAAFYMRLSADLADCSCSPNDADADGTDDCSDGCPLDANKIDPGVCGCGVADTDTDGDGTLDCNDGCVDDPNKIDPGTCGCGIADTDTDGDGAPDCIDGCVDDPAKTDPGQCGCGIADTDTDGDGTSDCIDGCVDDPAKIDPGQCGCGFAETDTDGDGTADCIDGCVDDPAKIDPGQCGCGFAETDTDGDGAADCIDGCDDDPAKVDPGLCGCGVADTDTDGDGAPDCIDGCDDDPAKVDPGVCGCGVSDADDDGDGTPNCIDGCASDPDKVDPGQCGCGAPDTDSDGDGTADCIDGCPADPDKTDPGSCGCGNPDVDTDGDGLLDCDDNCDTIANPGQEDCNQNGTGDACDIAAATSFDVNNSGVPDECEGTGIAYCFGDGSEVNCPCGNFDGYHAGCANSTGQGALLYNIGGASVSLDNAVMTVIQMPHNKSGLVFMGNAQVSLPFGDGYLCIFGGSIKRFPVQNSGATGSFVRSTVVALSNGLITSGSTWNFQGWYRDPFGPCAQTFNLSNAVQLTFQP